jgi:hypothetical protein
LIFKNFSEHNLVTYRRIYSSGLRNSTTRNFFLREADENLCPTNFIVVLHITTAAKGSNSPRRLPW